MQPEMYALHHRLEREHWWFAGRRRIVLDLLADALPPTPVDGHTIVDIGCGTGGMLPHLQRFGNAIGVDPSPLAAAYAAQDSIRIVEGALPDSLPIECASCDVVTLLDVIEHVEAEDEGLRAIAAVLRPGGLLVCTVPAYMWLWSDHDVHNEHFRRYTRASLRAALERNGFETLRLSYFNTVLFPPIAAVRLASRLRRRRAELNLGVVSGAANKWLERIFAAERLLLRRASFPFGVSIIALAHRVGADGTRRIR